MVQLLFFIKYIKKIAFLRVSFDGNKFKVFVLINRLHLALTWLFWVKANPEKLANLFLLTDCALKEIALVSTVPYCKTFHHLEV